MPAKGTSWDGSNAFQFDWEPNSGAMTCIPGSAGHTKDNKKTLFTFYTWGSRVEIRQTSSHQAFMVDGRWSQIQDGGMRAEAGIWVNDIHRDSKDSIFGNIGIGGCIWAFSGKNDSEERVPDNEGHFYWENGTKVDIFPIGNKYKYLSTHNQWGSYPNAVTATYKDSMGDITGGVERQMSAWDNQNFVVHGSKAPTDIRDGYWANIDGAIYSGARWPRIYWNRKGKAGATGPNDMNPRRFDDNHGLITALVKFDWVATEARGWADFGSVGGLGGSPITVSVPVVIPDIGPGDQGWIKALPGYPTIDEVGVDETSITVRYNVTQWQPQENRAFDDNECYQEIRGDRTGGRKNGVSTGYYTWKITGLTPGTCYSFYNFAQSNPKEYEGKAYKQSSRIYRQTMKKPSNPTATNNSRWDTPSVNVNVADWGNDTKFCNDANTIQKVNYVFNNSSTNTSGYSTTDYVNGHDVRVWGTWHSKDQDEGFWVHLQAVNNWGTSEWVHVHFETPDRLYRPGARKQTTWKSHQALNGKSHRCLGNWEEMTTRSEYAPNGSKHEADPPRKMMNYGWKNQDLEGTDPTWYAETGWGNVN